MITDFLPILQHLLQLLLVLSRASTFPLAPRPHVVPCACIFTPRTPAHLSESRFQFIFPSRASRLLFLVASRVLHSTPRLVLTFSRCATCLTCKVAHRLYQLLSRLAFVLSRRALRSSCLVEQRVDTISLVSCLTTLVESRFFLSTPCHALTMCRRDSNFNLVVATRPYYLSSHHGFYFPSRDPRVACSSPFLITLGLLSSKATIFSIFFHPGSSSASLSLVAFRMSSVCLPRTSSK